MSGIVSYQPLNTSSNQQAIEKRKKDELKEEKELASLVLLLKNVIEEIELSESPATGLNSLENEPLAIDQDQTLNTANNSSLVACAPAAASPTPTQEKYPTSSEVASALVCMSEMVSQLELQIQSSTNESYILATQIMISQINAEMAAMNEYISEYNKAVNDINSYFYWAYDQTGASEAAKAVIDGMNYTIYCMYSKASDLCKAMGLPPPPTPTYISYDDDFYIDPFAPYYDYGSTTVNSDVQNQINYYMSRTKTVTDTYQGKDGFMHTTTTTESDPDYIGLEKYIQAHCPCPITFPPNCTDPNEMLKIAGEQVQAYGCSEAQQATDNLESSLLLSSSPICRAIGQMIFSNMEFSEQAIQNLEQMMNSIINAMTLVSTLGSSGYNEGPSNGLVIQVLSIMTNAVSQMEALIASCQNKLAKDDCRISQKFTEAAGRNLEKVKQKTDELIKLMKEEEESEKIAKTVGIIQDVLMIAMAALTGNIGLIVCAAVMCALDQTGVLDELENKIASSIAKDLEKKGTSKEKAEKDSKAIAAGVVVGIVIAGSLVSVAGVEMAASMFAESSEIIAATEGVALNASEDVSAEASATAAKTSQEAAFISGEIASSEASNEIEMTSTLKSTKQNKMGDAIPPTEEAGATKNTNYLSNNQIMAISNGLQVVGSTNLAGYATEANLHGKKSEEEIQKESMKNSIIVDSAALVATMGLMSSMSEVKAAELFSTSKLSKMAKELLDVKYVVNGLSIVGIGASFIQSANEFRRGDVLKKQAEAELDLGLSKASLAFFEYIQDITNQLLQSTIKEYQDLLKSRGETDSMMLKTMLSFEAEYAKLLAQSA